jgi:hypothetical protein
MGLTMAVDQQLKADASKQQRNSTVSSKNTRQATLLVHELMDDVPSRNTLAQLMRN